MIVVGVVATIVIVLSQALPEISGQACEKVKTEQADQATESQTIVVPSSDVVPGGPMQINNVDRALLVTLETEKVEVPAVQCISLAISEYLQVLFSAIISPNAP